MDNLSAHKVAGVRSLVEARDAELLYLPPYSPDFNPIGHAWSKIKQLLRTAKARLLDALEAVPPERSLQYLRTTPSPCSATAVTGQTNHESALGLTGAAGRGCFTTAIAHN
jgi:transposase